MITYQHLQLTNIAMPINLFATSCHTTTRKYNNDERLGRGGQIGRKVDKKKNMLVNKEGSQENTNIYMFLQTILTVLGLNSVRNKR